MLWVLRGHLPVYLCYEEPLKGKAVLREAFKRQCCATVPFRGGFCAARANEEQPEQRPERRRGFCATSACRRGFCATGDRKRPLVAQDALEVPLVAQACRSDFVSLLIQFQWGGLHGRLPIAQIGLESAARRTGLPLTARHQRGRKVPFGQPERHQGGRKGFIGQLARHQGGRKGSMRAGKNHFWREAPGRQERIHWTACKAPERHGRGRKEPFGQPGKHQGGTREAGKDSLDSLRGTREAGKNHLHRLGGTREAAGRLIPVGPGLNCNASLRFSGFVHKCKELNNQITASIFWKKNTPQKDRHRCGKKTNLRWLSVICLYLQSHDPTQTDESSETN